jgi:hypothetical protein
MLVGATSLRLNCRNTLAGGRLHGQRMHACIICLKTKKRLNYISNVEGRTPELRYRPTPHL